MPQKPIKRDPGPQGPQGWTGPRGRDSTVPGPAGADGATGPAGPSFFLGSARFDGMGSITDAVVTGIVSSVDYAEPGRYNIFITEQPDIFYNVQVSSGDTGGGQCSTVNVEHGRKEVNAFRVTAFDATGTVADVYDVMVLISRPV